MAYRSSAYDNSPTTKRSVSIVLAFMAVVAVGGAIRWLQQRNTPLPTTATLSVSAGAATVVRADAGPDAPIAPGETTTLQRGDEVVTSADGKAKLTFRGGETVELGNSTRLGILELYQSPISRSLVALMALHEGTSLTRIRHMLFQGMRFEIETRVATVQARGTVFEANVVDKNHVYVAAYEGVVGVSMGEQAIELQAGQYVDVHLGQAMQALPLAEQPPTPEPTTAVVEGEPTLTQGQKTLFPPAVTPTRPGDNYQVYVVQEGDTLFSISRQFDVHWKTIWEVNKSTLPSPELIKPGQELRIPTS